MSGFGRRRRAAGEREVGRPSWHAVGVVFLVMLCSPRTSVAQDSQLVIPPGREAAVLEAVQAAFGDTPAASIAIEGHAIRVETGEDVALVATMADTMVDEVSVALVCEEVCDPDTRARWAPVAARLSDTLARAPEIWVPNTRAVATVRSTPTTDHAPDPTSSIPRYASWLLLLLVAVGLFVAPGARVPGSRRTLLIAVLGIVGFFAVALALSPPRPLHDHLCFVERTYCASTLVCDSVHHAWGRPTFHVMGLFLSLVPHRLPWILALGVALSAAALFFAYDVTTRVASRAGYGARCGLAGLFALALAALHPGFVRLAGTGSFWPLTLLLAFVALHLALRAAEGRGWRASVALLAAGAAFALVLGGNRLVLVLAPLIVIVPWAWRAPSLRPAHLLAVIAPAATFFFGARATVGGHSYGMPDRGPSEVIGALMGIPTEGALTSTFTTPLVAPVVIVALVAFTKRHQLRALTPLLYAFVAVAAASLFFAGELTWAAGYPDRYLKHFAQLFLVAPLFGLGMLAIVDFVAARLTSSERLERLERLEVAVAPLLMALLAVTAWTRPDAHRLLFAERVMEREVAALQQAFDSLPPHDEIVYSSGLLRPETVRLVGDPLEMHFPTGLYEAALRARGMTPGRISGLHTITYERPPGHRRLLYVGSVLRTFFGNEVSSGAVPATLERPELRRIRAQFELDPALVFALPTWEPRGAGNVVAPGADEVELGFYWLTPRPPDP